jgi:hypothetical protein
MKPRRSKPQAAAVEAPVVGPDDVIDDLPPPDLTDSNAIPPCPPSDPSMGDKTPEVIRWWHTHHPEEAAKRYENMQWDRSILD